MGYGKDENSIIQVNFNDSPGAQLQSDVNSLTTQLAEKANYYITPKTIPATNGTGEINADTLTSSGLYALYDNLISAYPDYITKTDLGLDASGTLHLYKYAFAPKNYNKTIIVGAGLHGQNENGDPRDNPIALYYAMKTICENWGSDNKLSQLRWNYQIVVMPIENPWGFDNQHRYNANGVDLNRNFDYNWSSYTSGGVNPFDLNYKGTAALSEVETQYIRNVLQSYPDALAYIPFHSWNDTNIPFKYVYEASSFSKLNNLAYNLTDYLTKKYNTTRSIGTSNDNVPNAFNYSEKVLNIPSANPEYTVFTTSLPQRSIEANTRMVEWYLNWIHLCTTYQMSSGNVGTFSPVLIGTTTAGTHTYANQKGFYQVINNRVFVDIYLSLSTKGGTMAGDARISGLPFTSLNEVNHSYAASISRLEYVSYGTAKSINVQLAENSNQLVLYKINDNGARTFVTTTDIGSTFTIVCSISYRIR